MDTTHHGVEGDDHDHTTHGDPVAEPFDQTNGLADGLEGDSDGSADSDVASEADRDEDGGLIGGLIDDDGSGPEDRDRDR